MTPKQREHHLSKVASVSLKDNDCTNVSIALPSLCTTPANTSLTLPLSAVNIPSLSREVIEGAVHLELLAYEFGVTVNSH